MGLLTSMGALATHIMLPALGVMGRDLGVADINHTTPVVLILYLGTAIGQLVVGPLSDAFGRKPSVPRAMVSSSRDDLFRLSPRAGR